MGGFVKGDVVVLSFPFSDLTGAKRRPALVVSDLDGDDIILCQITSQVREDRYAVKIADEDYVEGKLSSEGFIRPNKIFTADKNVILYTACLSWIGHTKHGNTYNLRKNVLRKLRLRRGSNETET